MHKLYESLSYMQVTIIALHWGENKPPLKGTGYKGKSILLTFLISAWVHTIECEKEEMKQMY